MIEHSYSLAKKLGEILKKRSLKLGTAESCTAGWIAKVITDVAGSSEYYEGGFIVYSNHSKHKFLGVSEQTLEKFGAVSKETATEMASGTIKNLPCDISLITTGIAGPTGGTKEKPVGTVFIGVAYGNNIMVQKFIFPGNRESVRIQAVNKALEMLIRFLEN